MALERLQKYLASAGVGSRRHCEKLILAGRVAVNGRTVTELGAKVDPEHDRTTLDGQPLKLPESHTYLLLNKPPGYVATAADERGRPTVLDLVQAGGARVFPVGRLDMDSEGLLLLITDGRLAQRLTHPRYGIEREYEVTLAGIPSEEGLKRLRQTAEVAGRKVAPKRVNLAPVPLPVGLVAGDQPPAAGRSPASFRVRMVLMEGRKREVRELARAAGYRVLRLVRVRYGPLRLGQLQPGAWRRLRPAEVHRLLLATRLVVRDDA